MSSQYNTNHSLIRRALNNEDSEAWEELTDFYEKFIYYLLRELGVSTNNLDDVAQEVLIALMKDLRSYDLQKGKFRTWLKTVILRKALMHFRSKRADKERIYDNSEQIHDVHEVQEAEVEKIIDEEWETYISALALERVSKSFKGNAVKVFEMALEGKTAQATAEELNITVDSVYILRKRVKRNMLLEVRALIEELEFR
ncbi:MAG: RNA polymerase sigma factor [Akkermansiaceae bacterium]